MRLIVAIEPPIETAERLTLLQEDLTEPLHLLGADVEWTRAERLRLNLHVVDIPTGTDVAWIRETWRAVFSALPARELHISGVRFIPSGESPMVIVTEVHGATEVLREAAGPALRAAGIPADVRPWAPLLQIGRLRYSGPPERLSAAIRPYTETRFGGGLVPDVVVAATELVRGEVRWSVLDRVSLGAREPG